VNILYNLAALYSHLACSTRQDPDGLKTACNYFSLAAGILKHLQSTLVPEMRSAPPADMDPWTLESLENLMLAQAQECFWQKAIMDGRLKDASIGRMAAAVADLYASAADLGTKSDGIRSEWLHHMKARHYHFMAAASYRISRDRLENRQYGEEVARLQDGLDCVRKGLSESKYINSAVVSDLEALEEKLADDFKRAEKDNDKLYYMRVPPKSELKTIDTLRMVTSKTTPEIIDPLSLLGENSELGRRLFENLVPYAVHEAQAKYEAAKTEKINKTINDDIERLNQIMQDMLKSLDLPGALMAVQQPLGVPEDLIHRAEELKQQKAPHLLQTLSHSVEAMKMNGQELFFSAVQTLRAEADEDEGARQKFGTDRWNRQSSEQANPELWAQVKQLEGWLEHAKSSDALIAKKMADSEKLIILLSGPIRDLEQYVPSSSDVTLSPQLNYAVFELQSCFSEWHRVLRRRLRKIEDVRIKAREDSICKSQAQWQRMLTSIDPLLVREATRLESESVNRRINVDQLTILFGKRLAAYDSDQNLVREEEHNQEQLIEKFKQTHDRFVAARKGDTSSNKRAQALQSLDKAYLNYKKIISNLEGAKKFYKDFLVSAGKFRDDCQAYTYKRRAEAAHMYS
jgi:programmed cell death 6-interacting protein